VCSLSNFHQITSGSAFEATKSCHLTAMHPEAIADDRPAIGMV